MAPQKRDCTCPRAYHPHGTIGAYQQDRCRCLPCRLAKSETRRNALNNGGDWRASRWCSAVGVARRLRALTAIGYSDRRLAAHIGTDASYIRQLRAQKIPKITPRTFARVAAAYDKLWATPQTGPYTARTIATANRNGWAPPLAWDDESIDDPRARPTSRPRAVGGVVDEIAVELAMRGERVPLMRVERAEAVARLTRRKLSAAEIAELLGTTKRTVVRRRASERLDGAA